MRPRHLPLAALTCAVLSFTQSGCVEALQIGFGILGAIGQAAAGGSARSSGGWGGVSEETMRPIYRSMSACELERGQWRETHPNETEPPPHLRCTDGGDYPMVHAGFYDPATQTVVHTPACGDPATADPACATVVTPAE